MLSRSSCETVFRAASQKCGSEAKGKGKPVGYWCGGFNEIRQTSGMRLTLLFVFLLESRDSSDAMSVCPVLSC